MLYGCTPFCVEAVERINSLEPDFIKVGGAGWQNTAMLEAIHATGRRVILSMGCDFEDLMPSFARDWERLFCASSYPTPPERSGLGRFSGEAIDGLSDHSGTPWAGLYAIANGADIVEVHFPKEGPDAASSLDDAQLGALVEGARWMCIARESGKPVHDAEVVRLASAR